MSPSSDSFEHLRSVLETAEQFDPTVKVERDVFPRMLRRYVPPVPYTRAKMFGRMLEGEPSVLTGFPKPLQGPLRKLSPPEAGSAIIDWFDGRRKAELHRVYTGPTGVRRHLTLHDIGVKWRANRTRFGVTDLHIRDTEMEDVIAPDVLSGFNVLPRSTVDARAQEMFSFVISSRGHVTDSHSDAPDSTNYCFTGRKLWLAWDTYEGMKRGLQDVDRVPVHGRARFSIEDWLSLSSARWFLVNPGETLFLPANLTHKVITLERYIGVGGFFIALPNCLRLMSHWVRRAPLWTKGDGTGCRDELLGEIAETVRDTIVRLRTAPLKKRQECGYDFLEQSAEVFIKSCPPKVLRELWADERFRCVADVIRAPWPSSLSRAA